MMFPIVRAPIKDQTVGEMGIKEAILWDRSCAGGSGGRRGRFGATYTFLLLGDAGFKGGAGVGSPCLNPIGGFRE